MDFKTLLKNEISDRGISQVEAARLIGVKPPEVNQYIKGHKKPSVQRLRVFSVFLGISTDELIHAIEMQD